MVWLLFRVALPALDAATGKVGFNFRDLVTRAALAFDAS
jgi:hypothetical protein